MNILFIYLNNPSLDRDNGCLVVDAGWFYQNNPSSQVKSPVFWLQMCQESQFVGGFQTGEEGVGLGEMPGAGGIAGGQVAGYVVME